MTLLERLGGREAITRGIVHTFRIPVSYTHLTLPTIAEV